ncbi:MAG TPA: hypothetical protein VIN04_05810 [Myxococcota bacterium]
MRKEDPVEDPVGLEPALAGELAQLEALRRMALGAAHAWNNALTSILGDLRWLREERADDPVVRGVCTEIEREAQRCVRLSRALQARGHWQPGVPGDLDLGAVLAGLAPVLRDTVSRSVELTWEIPEDAPWVHGRRADAELLVLLAAQALLRDAPGGSTLHIALGKPEEHHVCVSLERRDGDKSAARDDSPWDALVTCAARTLAATCEADWQVEPERGRGRVRFRLAA